MFRFRSYAGMGFNPRYRQWTRENWQGYAGTIGRMQDLCWSLTMHCGLCDLAMVADAKAIIRARGKNYSPWGKSARCRRLGCGGRMRMKAHDPRSNERIDI